MQLIIVTGNLTRDPEIRTTQNGKQVCNFTVACNKRGNGENVQTVFYHVSAWDKLGDICSKFLKKGRKVAVSGEPSLNAYTKRDGTPSATIAILAKDVEFMNSKFDGEEMDDAMPSAAGDMMPAGGYMVVNEEDLPF